MLDADDVVKEPKVAEVVGWATLVVALIGVIGSIGTGSIRGLVVWEIVGIVTGLHLVGFHLVRSSAAAKEAAARTDREDRS